MQMIRYELEMSNKSAS